jgi:hypothetical protein
MLNSIAFIICTYIVYIVSVRIVSYLKKILSELKSMKGLLSSIEFNNSDHTKPYTFEDSSTCSSDFELDDFNFDEDTKKMLR